MVDREASSKRLEMQVKRVSSISVTEEPHPSRDAATNMVSAADVTRAFVGLGLSKALVFSHCRWLYCSCA